MHGGAEDAGTVVCDSPRARDLVRDPLGRSRTLLNHPNYRSGVDHGLKVNTERPTDLERVLFGSRWMERASGPVGGTCADTDESSDQ